MMQAMTRFPALILSIIVAPMSGCWADESGLWSG
jgi:hypothetical protein